MRGDYQEWGVAYPEWNGLILSRTWYIRSEMRLSGVVRGISGVRCGYPEWNMKKQPAEGSAGCWMDYMLTSVLTKSLLL